MNLVLLKNSCLEDYFPGKDESIQGLAVGTAFLHANLIGAGEAR